ncbi:hypothetical protein ABL78_5388 [Leptomonas seymouri]|uniref:Uncharacterized protein n=1 Tax=Leptomonas seymouri TaxID=5684 RepID=A0A0N0P4P9_LEPSE|nr:hypothetical protein ABL78_5388 [Leptomonas seymouri]|eukprot:KPI85559.1 hypothetical protein ABL78_5388 [Leptomonas seymouri]
MSDHSPLLSPLPKAALGNAQLHQQHENSAAKAATRHPEVETRHSSSGRYVQPHSTPSQFNSTATRAGSAPDVQSASSDGLRKSSPCLSDLSLSEGAGGVHRFCEHPDTQHASADEFPSTTLASSPTQERGLWQGVESGVLALGYGAKQPRILHSQGRAGLPPGGASTPLRPPNDARSSPSTPREPALLLPLQPHTPDTATGSSLTASPQSATTAPPPKSPPAARSRKAQRRLYRMSSALARQAVVASQRHRKLLELDNVDSMSRNDDRRDREGQGDMDKRALLYSGNDASAGWMAALMSPMSTHTRPGRAESDPPHHSGPRALSTMSSAPLNSSLGALTACSTSATAAPPAAPSHSPNSARTVSKAVTRGGSFETTTSLNSLQLRLWQHTATGVAAAPSTYKREGGSKTARSLPLPLSSSPSPARLPPLQRLQSTKTANSNQGRHGKYTKSFPHNEDRGKPLSTAAPVASASGNATLVSHTLTDSPRAVASPSVPVAQWKAALMDERARGRQGKRMAQWLVEHLLTTPPPTDFDRSRYASFRIDNDNEGNPLDALRNDLEENSDGSGGLLRMLSERAAIAAYLLNTLIEDGLPRHQQSVLPYVRMLIEFSFVPDTPALRAALGADSVQDEELLDRLAEYDSCVLPITAANAVSSSPKTSDLKASQEMSETADEVVALTDLFAPSFTRKTYITAHFELSGITVGLAHEVRCRELHQRNVPRLLERTHKNWMRGLMRSALRAWRHLCQERRVQQQRQRARWALRWTGERLRISLRRWRGYAGIILQSAEADNVAMATLMQKRAFIERLEEETAAMQLSSQQLQEALQRQDEEREVVEERITEREILYQRLLQQVREVDRVGSLMLNSLLLEKAPPRFDDASVITAVVPVLASRLNTHRSSLLSMSSSLGALGSVTLVDSHPTTEDGDADEYEEPRLPHVVTALPTLLQWANDCCKVAEDEYLSVYLTDVEYSDREKKGYSTSESSGQPTPRTPQSNASPQPSAQSEQSDTESDSTVETYHPPLDFSALLLSTTNEVKLSNVAAGETVLLPLHKLLLLIRGCSGVKGKGGRPDSEGRGETAASPTRRSPEPASAMIDSMADAEEREMADGVAAAVAPSLGMIRTVQRADADVLKEAYALLDKRNRVFTSHSSGSFSPSAMAATVTGDAVFDKGSIGAPSSGLPLMLCLSTEKRETLQRICSVVVDAYEHLTGTACVVTADQLFERSRGVLLVFLAALMRHYTNWMVRRTQQALPVTTIAAAAAPSDGASEAASTTAVQAAAVARNAESMGVAHQRYDEWSHPPRSHRRWCAQVRRQAEWIALSFSALHSAMRVGPLYPRLLTLGQQDHVSGLLEQLSLAELMDLLPNSPDQTMQCYVSMVGAVERYAPSLHLLFHHFALPLAQLRADGGAAAATAAKPKPGQSIHNDYVQNGSAGAEVYVTANTVWRLLCMAGLAGEAKKRSTTRSEEQEKAGGRSDTPYVTLPLSATLHRPAVFSLIEQVTQNGVAPTRLNRRRTTSRRGTAFGTQSDPDVEDPQADLAMPPPVQSVSCKMRPRAYYARALHEGRYLDLRPDTGAVCVNYVQFVKVLIRLAHAWQCQQQQQEEAEHEAAQQRAGAQEEKCETPQEMDEEAGTQKKVAGVSDDKELTPDGRRCSSSIPVLAPAAATRRSYNSSVLGPRKSSRPSLISMTSSLGATSSVHVEYEAGDYVHTLCLPYFDAFLGELLLPRLLGANRWINAVQWAMCSRPVLQLLAQHHDALVTIFNDYQRPREARGVRSSLPPPYSTVLASQLFSRVVESERQSISRLAPKGGRRVSHAHRASFMYGLSSSNNRCNSNAMMLEEGGNPNKKGGGENTGSDRGTSRNSLHQRRSWSKRLSLSPQHLAQDDGKPTEELRNSIAAAQFRDVSIVSVMQWDDVLALAKDMQWFSILRLTENALRLCFEHVQADVTREGDAIFFSEFTQLLCTMSLYASKNPAVPLEVKLERFLEAYVLSAQD